MGWKPGSRRASTGVVASLECMQRVLSQPSPLFSSKEHCRYEALESHIKMPHILNPTTCFTSSKLEKAERRKTQHCSSLWKKLFCIPTQFLTLSGEITVTKPNLFNANLNLYYFNSKSTLSWANGQKISTVQIQKYVYISCYKREDMVQTVTNST